MSDINAEIIRHDGRKVLVYTEPDDENTILHMITMIGDIAHADLKLTFESDEEDVWEMASSVDFEFVRRKIDEDVTSFERSVLANTP